MTALRNRFAHGAVWAVGALLGAISSVALLIAAAVPAILGLLSLLLVPIRALARRVGRPAAWR